MFFANAALNQIGQSRGSTLCIAQRTLKIKVNLGSFLFPASTKTADPLHASPFFPGLEVIHHLYMLLVSYLKCSKFS